jgi:hypothetical protein
MGTHLNLEERRIGQQTTGQTAGGTMKKGYKTAKTEFDFTAFKAECIKRGWIKANGCHNSKPGERLQIKSAGLDINRIVDFKIKSAVIKFKVQVVLQTEDAGEVVYVSGTKSKDGLYYFDNTGSMTTAEDLQGDVDDVLADGLAFIEEHVDDYDEFKKLDADKQVKIFEKAEQLSFICKSLRDLLSGLEMVKFKADKAPAGKGNKSISSSNAKGAKMGFKELKQTLKDQKVINDASKTIKKVLIKGTPHQVSSTAGYEFKSKVAGFTIRYVLATEKDKVEVICISGSEKKDGIYFFFKGKPFGYSERLAGSFDDVWEAGFSFIEEFVDSYDAYKKLSVDEKVALFEKKKCISFLCASYNELFDLLIVK